MTATLELSAVYDHSARARLFASPLGGLADDECVVDLFCGAGGWGEGAKELGIDVDFAVNHDAVAIRCHEANNPGCAHHRGDAWRARPRSIVGRRRVGVLFASAACTTHSRARGGAPISKRVHMLGWCIARWMEEAAPRVVMIENVVEWKDWGPVTTKRHANGKVVKDGQGRLLYVQRPEKKGTHFRRWWRYCESLGYAMEARVLDAPDFGSGSRRKRLFIQARRDGMPIAWPQPTHGPTPGVEKGTSDVGKEDGVDQRRCDPVLRASTRRNSDGLTSPRRRTEPDNTPAGDREPGDADRQGEDGVDDVASRGAERRPYVTAADCIDWSDLGTSIFERKRSLKPKTLARIVEGIRRYVLDDPAPFVLRVSQPHAPGGGWHVWPVDRPMPTQTARADVAMATPVMQVIRGDVAGRDVRDSMPTITAGNGPGRGAGAGHALGLATPVLTPAGGPDAPPFPVGVATPILAGAGGSAYSGKPVRVDAPMGTVKCDDHRALITPLLMNNTTHHTGGRVDAPTPTVTTGGQAGLVVPTLAYLKNHTHARRVDEPVGTLQAGGTHAMLVAALMMEYYGGAKSLRRPDAPLGCVPTLDRHGLVCVVIHGVEFVIVDILFRMLRPAELARAMGFRDGMVWARTQRDTVRLIGNAVSPPVARALVGAALPRGRGRISAGAGREERAA